MVFIVPSATEVNFYNYCVSTAISVSNLTDTLVVNRRKASGEMISLPYGAIITIGSRRSECQYACERNEYLFHIEPPAPADQSMGALRVRRLHNLSFLAKVVNTSLHTPLALSKLS